jgi:hypothetical protein
LPSEPCESFSRGLQSNLGLVNPTSGSCFGCDQSPRAGVFIRGFAQLRSCFGVCAPAFTERRSDDRQFLSASSSLPRGWCAGNARGVEHSRDRSGDLRLSAGRRRDLARDVDRAADCAYAGENGAKARGLPLLLLQKADA